MTNAGNLTRFADVFSYGVVLWELYCSRCAWTYGPQGRLVHQRGFPHLPPSCPRSYAQLVSICMQPAHKQRPTFKQIGNMIDSMLRDLSRLGSEQEWWSSLMNTQASGNGASVNGASANGNSSSYGSMANMAGGSPDAPLSPLGQMPRHGMPDGNAPRMHHAPSAPTMGTMAGAGYGTAAQEGGGFGGPQQQQQPHMTSTASARALSPFAAQQSAHWRPGGGGGGARHGMGLGTDAASNAAGGSGSLDTATSGSSKSGGGGGGEVGSNGPERQQSNADTSGLLAAPGTTNGAHTPAVGPPPYVLSGSPVGHQTAAWVVPAAGSSASDAARGSNSQELNSSGFFGGSGTTTHAAIHNVARQLAPSTFGGEDTIAGIRLGSSPSGLSAGASGSVGAMLGAGMLAATMVAHAVADPTADSHAGSSDGGAGGSSGATQSRGTAAAAAAAAVAGADRGGAGGFATVSNGLGFVADSGVWLGINSSDGSGGLSRSDSATTAASPAGQLPQMAQRQGSSGSPVALPRWPSEYLAGNAGAAAAAAAAGAAAQQLPSSPPPHPWSPATARQQGAGGSPGATAEQGASPAAAMLAATALASDGALLAAAGLAGLRSGGPVAPAGAKADGGGAALVFTVPAELPRAGRPDLPTVLEVEEEMHMVNGSTAGSGAASNAATSSGTAATAVVTGPGTDADAQRGGGPVSPLLTEHSGSSGRSPQQSVHAGGSPVTDSATAASSASATAHVAAADDSAEAAAATAAVAEPSIATAPGAGPTQTSAPEEQSGAAEVAAPDDAPQSQGHPAVNAIATASAPVVERTDPEIQALPVPTAQAAPLAATGPAAAVAAAGGTSPVPPPVPPAPAPPPRPAIFSAALGRFIRPSFGVKQEAAMAEAESVAAAAAAGLLPPPGTATAGLFARPSFGNSFLTDCPPAPMLPTAPSPAAARFVRPSAGMPATDAVAEAEAAALTATGLQEAAARLAQSGGGVSRFIRPSLGTELAGGGGGPGGDGGAPYMLPGGGAGGAGMVVVGGHLPALPSYSAMQQPASASQQHPSMAMVGPHSLAPPPPAVPFARPNLADMAASGTTASAAGSMGPRLMSAAPMLTTPTGPPQMQPPQPPVAMHTPMPPPGLFGAGAGPITAALNLDPDQPRFSRATHGRTHDPTDLTPDLPGPAFAQAALAAATAAAQQLPPPPPPVMDSPNSGWGGAPWWVAPGPAPMAGPGGPGPWAPAGGSGSGTDGLPTFSGIASLPGGTDSGSSSIPCSYNGTPLMPGSAAGAPGATGAAYGSSGNGFAFGQVMVVPYSVGGDSRGPSSSTGAPATHRPWGPHGGSTGSVHGGSGYGLAGGVFGSPLSVSGLAGTIRQPVSLDYQQQQQAQQQSSQPREHLSGGVDGSALGGLGQTLSWRGRRSRLGVVPSAGAAGAGVSAAPGSGGNSPGGWAGGGGGGGAWAGAAEYRNAGGPRTRRGSAGPRSCSYSGWEGGGSSISGSMGSDGFGAAGSSAWHAGAAPPYPAANYPSSWLGLDTPQLRSRQSSHLAPPGRLAAAATAAAASMLVARLPSPQAGAALPGAAIADPGAPVFRRDGLLQMMAGHGSAGELGASALGLGSHRSRDSVSGSLDGGVGGGGAARQTSPQPRVTSGASKGTGSNILEAIKAAVMGRKHSHVQPADMDGGAPGSSAAAQAAASASEQAAQSLSNSRRESASGDPSASTLLAAAAATEGSPVVAHGPFERPSLPRLEVELQRQHSAAEDEAFALAFEAPELMEAAASGVSGGSAGAGSGLGSGAGGLVGLGGFGSGFRAPPLPPLHEGLERSSFEEALRMVGKGSLSTVPESASEGGHSRCSLASVAALDRTSATSAGGRAGQAAGGSSSHSDAVESGVDSGAVEAAAAAAEPAVPRPRTAAPARKGSGGQKTSRGSGAGGPAQMSRMSRDQTAAKK